MGVAVEPWQMAEIPGPKKALTITNPQIVASLIKRSKNPIMVVGHKAAVAQLGNGLLIDYIIRIGEKAGIPVVSTPSIQSEFIKRGFSRVVGMPLVDIANRLVDPGWIGLEGKGSHDLAIFIGFTYYVGWLILSGLKHFSPQIKTVSIDMHYQPHASWSLPNMSLSDWEKNLEMLIGGLEVK